MKMIKIKNFGVDRSIIKHYKYNEEQKLLSIYFNCVLYGGSSVLCITNFDSNDLMEFEKKLYNENNVIESTDDCAVQNEWAIDDLYGGIDFNSLSTAISVLDEIKHNYKDNCLDCSDIESVLKKLRLEGCRKFGGVIN